MTLPATSPEPAAEAEALPCSYCLAAVGAEHADGCFVDELERALGETWGEDSDVFDLNDGEDWGWEP